MSINKKRSNNEINVQLQQKESKFAIKKVKDNISLPAVIVFSGSRGSGKTYSCIALMRPFEKKHYIMKTFLFCPTRHSNDLYTNLKMIDEKDCFEQEHTFGLALHQILSTVQKEWNDYNAELRACF